MGRPLSIERSGQMTADVFTGWLADEVVSSSEGHNKALDNYKAAIRGLKGGWEHAENFSRIKHESHIDNRMPLWWEQYVQEPENDLLSAKILFNALMQISGTYRAQCYMQAQDTGEYLELRRERPHDINMDQAVTGQMRIWLPPGGNFSTASISLEELDERRLKVSRAGGIALKSVSSWAKQGYGSFGEIDSASVRKLREAQFDWATFATDCVVMAAKTRNGDLRAVPFWEPKSISEEPEVIYPLAA